MMQHHHAQDASLFNGYVENLLGLAVSSSGGHALGQVHTARSFLPPQRSH